jgi:hypothetical protein
MDARVVALALLTLAPELVVGREAIETVCAFTVRTEDGRFRIVPSETLRVLDQVSETGAFVLPSDAPSDIASIMCARTSPVPSKNDMLVPRAGYPLYIAAPPAGGPNRVFVLSLEAGVLTYKATRGSLTDDESKQVDGVLSEMNESTVAPAPPGT